MTNVPTDALVLETLYGARARLADPTEDFEYMDYSSCTCGFIYLAAEGRRGVVAEVIGASHPVYVATIVGTARALGWDGDLGDYRGTGAEARAAIYFVSCYTFQLGRFRGLRYAEREDAVATVDEAIAALEAANESARLRILEDAFAAPAAPEPVGV